MRSGVTRGQVFSMDALPAELDAVRALAIQQVTEQRLTQKQMLQTINDAIAAHGDGVMPISRSALNRWITYGLENGFADRTQRLCCPHCGRAISPLAGARP